MKTRTILLIASLAMFGAPLGAHAASPSSSPSPSPSPEENLGWLRVPAPCVAVLTREYTRNPKPHPKLIGFPLSDKKVKALLERPDFWERMDGSLVAYFRRHPDQKDAMMDKIFHDVSPEENEPLIWGQDSVCDMLMNP